MYFAPANVKTWPRTWRSVDRQTLALQQKNRCRNKFFLGKEFCLNSPELAPKKTVKRWIPKKLFVLFWAWYFCSGLQGICEGFQRFCPDFHQIKVLGMHLHPLHPASYTSEQRFAQKSCLEWLNSNLRPAVPSFNCWIAKRPPVSTERK